MCCTCNISCAVPAIFQGGGSKMCIRIVRLFQLLCGIQSIVMLQTAAPPLNYRATFKTTAPPLNYRATFKTTAPPLNYRARLSSYSAVFFSCAFHTYLLYRLLYTFYISPIYRIFLHFFLYAASLELWLLHFLRIRGSLVCIQRRRYRVRSVQLLLRWLRHFMPMAR